MFVSVVCMFVWAVVASAFREGLKAPLTRVTGFMFELGKNMISIGIFFAPMLFQ